MKIYAPGKKFDCYRRAYVAVGKRQTRTFLNYSAAQARDALSLFLPPR